MVVQQFRDRSPVVLGEQHPQGAGGVALGGGQQGGADVVAVDPVHQEGERVVGPDRGQRADRALLVVGAVEVLEVAHPVVAVQQPGEAGARARSPGRHDPLNPLAHLGGQQVGRGGGQARIGQHLPGQQVGVDRRFVRVGHVPPFPVLVLVRRRRCRLQLVQDPQRPHGEAGQRTGLQQHPRPGPLRADGRPAEQSERLVGRGRREQPGTVGAQPAARPPLVAQLEQVAVERLDQDRCGGGTDTLQHGAHDVGAVVAEEPVPDPPVEALQVPQCARGEHEQPAQRTGVRPVGGAVLVDPGHLGRHQVGDDDPLLGRGSVPGQCPDRLLVLVVGRRGQAGADGVGGGVEGGQVLRQPGDAVVGVGGVVGPEPAAPLLDQTCQLRHHPRREHHAVPGDPGVHRREGHITPRPGVRQGHQHPNGGSPRRRLVPFRTRPQPPLQVPRALREQLRIKHHTTPRRHRRRPHVDHVLRRQPLPEPPGGIRRDGAIRSGQPTTTRMQRHPPHLRNLEPVLVGQHQLAHARISVVDRERPTLEVRSDKTGPSI